MKRVSVLSAGIVAGLGIPAVVFASQQQTAPESQSQAHSANITIDTSTSPQTGEVFSATAGKNAADSTPPSNSSLDATVTVNGETVPLTNGSTTRQFTDSTGSVDINVTIDSSQTSSSSSSSTTTTNISIDSTNTSVTNDENNTRGSPRR